MLARLAARLNIVLHLDAFVHRPAAAIDIILAGSAPDRTRRAIAFRLSRALDRLNGRRVAILQALE